MSVTIKQAIDGFLLSCKVEGKSDGAIEYYSGKLKDFLWYVDVHDFSRKNEYIRLINFSNAR